MGLERLPQPTSTSSHQTSSTECHSNSLANKLKKYRVEHGYQTHLPESLLLRDMVYLLQGIDGKYVYFKLSTSEEESWEEEGIGFNPSNDLIITLPQRDLVLKLTELGWLYKKIEGAVDRPDPSTGIIQQAFGFALREELGTYYRSIAVIESHLTSSHQTHLTLKSLLLHLTPTVLKLRMSAALISATKNTRGGQLISVLHSYTDHGDPVVHLFTSNLLEKVSVPWFKTLAGWMWDGELIDPMDEFFIKSNSQFDRRQRNHVGEGEEEEEELDGRKVWNGQFSFRKEMVPSFIGELFARK